MIKKFLILACFSFLPVGAETLHYSINWPSGLSLGEAELTSNSQKDGWNFHASLDASLPGFPLRDTYSSLANTDFCSSSLTKESLHGTKKSSETDSFDQAKMIVTRQTRSPGGKSELSVGPCARDALTFLQFVRRELAQGRVAAPQQVVFGSLYNVRMEFTGSQNIKVADKHVDTDCLRITFKGPSSDYTFELYFSKDPARTPVLARLPLPLGAFTVELLP